VERGLRQVTIDDIADEQVPDPQWIEGTRLMPTEAVAERTGTDLYPVLVAIAAGGAIRATMQQAGPRGLAHAVQHHPA
jgi:hypothetical protein